MQYGNRLIKLFRQHHRTAFQNPMNGADQHAVIDHGHILQHTAFGAILHFSLIEHTAAAVHDQGVGRKVIGKFRAGAGTEFRIHPGILPDPAGDLYRADIVALAVMGTALGDEDFIAVFQPGKTVDTL